MGYLTTLTVYNDGLHLLEDEKNAVEFCKKLVNVAKDNNSSFYLNINETIGLGGFSNFCTVQKPRHSNEPSVYVQLDNTIIESNPHDTFLSNIPHPSPSKTTLSPQPKMEVIYKRNNSFFKKIIKVLSNNLSSMIDLMSEKDLKENILDDTGVLPNKKLNEKIHQELLLESFKNKNNNTLNNYIKLFN